jgi:hypothetical protein
MTITREIEGVPPFVARAGTHGFEVAARSKYIGIAIQGGWRWLSGGPFTIFGWDVYCSGKKFFNGPRSWSIGTIGGFLRLRFGIDVVLFTGKRDPAIQAQIDAAMAQFTAASKAACDAQIAKLQAKQAKTIDVGAPKVSITDEAGLILE